MAPTRSHSAHVWTNPDNNVVGKGPSLAEVGPQVVKAGPSSDHSLPESSHRFGRARSEPKQNSAADGQRATTCDPPNFRKAFCATWHTPATHLNFAINFPCHIMQGSPRGNTSRAGLGRARSDQLRISELGLPCRASGRQRPFPSKSEPRATITTRIPHDEVFQQRWATSPQRRGQPCLSDDSTRPVDLGDRLSG